MPLPPNLPDRIEQYDAIMEGLARLPKAKRVEHLRVMCRTDLYFLLRYALRRPDMQHPWIFARCREVQDAPNDFIDLWAREHYKSTVITFGQTIQDILNDPNVTFGIFAHTRPISKAFLRQIKREFEDNSELKDWFPDILWQNPAAESPKWSEDEGIIVKRTSNPKEATVEAWGVVEGQPTSKHFSHLVYDDLVTLETVSTPDQIAKCVSALEISYNLGSDGGIRRMIGTRYHFNDPYREVINRGTFTPRVHPGTVDGTVTGKPVMWSAETLRKKRRDYGPYNFAAQILMNPVADEQQGFKREWLRFYRSVGEAREMNKIILVDPANSKKKTSDYTAILVIGLAPDNNAYVLDIIKDRLNLTQRAQALFHLHRRWRPVEVRYERYGMMADIDHIKEIQERDNYRFDIKEVGDPTPKIDRIRRLIPWFEQGRIYMPRSLHKTIYDGSTVDLINQFIEMEYAGFPVAIHEDVMDALARLAQPDMPLPWPMISEEEERETADDEMDGTEWMSA